MSTTENDLTMSGESAPVEAQNESKKRSEWQSYLSTINVDENEPFTFCIGSIIDYGPSLKDGELIIKQFLKNAAKANKENGAGYIRVYPPVGFQIPNQWHDEIYN